MFNVDLKPTFTCPVIVSIPSGDGVIQQSFRAKFAALDIPDFSGFDLASPVGAQGFLERTLLSVSDVVDEEGNALPSSPQLLGRIVELPWARTALIRAYLSAFTRAAQGN